ncbi:hypothetical protein Tco_0630456 [Tanacetum coccineum]
MNQEQIQQATNDEALVPTADRVKISTINMWIDPTLTPKEETNQVNLDIIKTLPCYNAFLITGDVPEIYIQQFWFTVKKILCICPRVPNEEFVEPPSKESLLTFLIELGYKGQLNQLSSMFVDHMHQPWRTLTTIINKFLSRKTSSNDKLRQSRVGILWGGQSSGDVKLCLTPRFSKIIIDYFLSQNKSIPRRHGSYINTIKDDDVLGRLKFVSKGEDYQVYGKAIPDTIKGKGSKGKKAAITSKKKSSITTDDNIIPEPNVAFELGKSINKTKAKIAEEATRVHEPHERLVTEKPKSVEESNESDGEPANRPTRRRKPIGVVFRDTSNVSKKKSLDQSQKLKGIQVLTEEERFVPEVPDEAKGSSAAKVDAAIDWGSEDESDWCDDANVKEETSEDEKSKSDNNEYVDDDADEEMKE